MNTPVRIYKTMKLSYIVAALYCKIELKYDFLVKQIIKIFFEGFFEINFDTFEKKG
jgi:hypothetical protein